MTRIRSFPPIATATAHTLILGSMPGQASLDAGQYYAHPRNAFWPIVSELLELEAGATYAARTRALKNAGIALWDVLESCNREGSLDANIRRDTLVPNQFAAFFAAHRRIKHVFCNGAGAERLFRQLVLHELTDFPVSLVRLPSTSPAHAALSQAGKLTAWRAILTRA